jgi:hypothetical protein
MGFLIDLIHRGGPLMFPLFLPRSSAWPSSSYGSDEHTHMSYLGSAWHS